MAIITTMKSGGLNIRFIIDSKCDPPVSGRRFDVSSIRSDDGRDVRIYWIRERKAITVFITDGDASNFAAFNHQGWKMLLQNRIFPTYGSAPEEKLLKILPPDSFTLLAVPRPSPPPLSPPLPSPPPLSPPLPSPPLPSPPSPPLPSPPSLPPPLTLPLPSSPPMEGCTATGALSPLLGDASPVFSPLPSTDSAILSPLMMPLDISSFDEEEACEADEKSMIWESRLAKIIQSIDAIADQGESYRKETGHHALVGEAARTLREALGALKSITGEDDLDREAIETVDRRALRLSLLTPESAKWRAVPFVSLAMHAYFIPAYLLGRLICALDWNNSLVSIEFSSLLLAAIERRLAELEKLLTGGETLVTHSQLWKRYRTTHFAGYSYLPAYNVVSLFEILEGLLVAELGVERLMEELWKMFDFDFGAGPTSMLFSRFSPVWEGMEIRAELDGSVGLWREVEVVPMFHTSCRSGTAHRLGRYCVACGVLPVPHSSMLINEKDDIHNSDFVEKCLADGKRKYIFDYNERGWYTAKGKREDNFHHALDAVLSIPPSSPWTLRDETKKRSRGSIEDPNKVILIIRKAFHIVVLPTGDGNISVSLTEGNDSEQSYTHLFNCRAAADGGSYEVYFMTREAMQMIESNQIIIRYGFPTVLTRKLLLS